jgi:hypothetical protein
MSFELSEAFKPQPGFVQETHEEIWKVNALHVSRVIFYFMRYTELDLKI